MRSVCFWDSGDVESPAKDYKIISRHSAVGSEKTETRHVEFRVQYVTVTPKIQ